MARDFRNKTFQKVLRGYAQKEVDDYIEYLNDEYKKMEQRALESERKYELARKKFDEALKNPGSGDAVGSVAKEAAARLLRKAEARWTEIIASAEEEAEMIRAEARAGAQAHKDDAKRIYDTAQTLFGEINSFRDKLFDLYNEHLSAVDEITETTQNFMNGIQKTYTATYPEEQQVQSGSQTEKRKPSIEQPWLNLYPPQLVGAREQLFAIQGKFTLAEYIGMSNSDHSAPIIDFYGKKYSFDYMMAEADKVAKALASLGVREGDRLCAFLRSVPEYIAILFACEKVGATLICRDGTLEEQLESLQVADAKILFAHDYTEKAEKLAYYNNSKLEHIIEISPYYYGLESAMPDYVKYALEELYFGEQYDDERDIRWGDFLKMGEDYTGEYLASPDPYRPLCNPYTSGSTGPSKEIIHCAASMIGYLTQLNFPNSSTGKTVLLTCLPPTLIAILNALFLYNMAQANCLILSSYCRLEDIDLELMRCKPWMMMTVPQMAEHICNSKRIPEDYDLSFLKLFGGGADPLNNAKLKEVHDWLKAHNSEASFTQAYVLSECGSSVCMDVPGASFYDCCVGAPITLATVGIFHHETNEELGYNEVGEICVQTPAHMLGYGGIAAPSTEEVIKTHDDGRVFIHTGDYGAMDERGFVYHYGRGLSSRFGFEGKHLYSLVIENKVCTIEGVRDAFSINSPDKEHPGFFNPYLFIIPREGYTLEQLTPEVMNVLEEHERPVKILPAEKREYYHFKLNRRFLAEQIAASEQ